MPAHRCAGGGAARYPLHHESKGVSPHPVHAPEPADPYDADRITDTCIVASFAHPRAARQSPGPGSTERQEAYMSGVWYAGIGAAFVLGLLFVIAYSRRGGVPAGRHQTAAGVVNADG